MTHSIPRWWQRRRGPVGLLGINLVLVALISSSVLAVLPDEAVSPGNNLESGGIASVLEVTYTYVPGSPCDLDADTHGNVYSVISSDAVPTVSEDELIDLRPGATLPSVKQLCFKNVSSGPIGVGVTITEEIYRSFEVGDCLPQEIDAGDTTCGDGLAGELDEIAYHAASRDPESTSASCLEAGEMVAPILKPGGRRLIDRHLDPGEMCAIRIYPKISEQATDAQLLQAANDRVEFTVVYYADDPVIAP